MAIKDHVRTVYNLVNFIGDLGGVVTMLWLLFGFLLSPIAEHSFNLKAIEKGFSKKTNGKKKGGPQRKNKIASEEANMGSLSSIENLETESNEDSQSAPIQFSFIQGINLFIINKLFCCG